MMSYIWIMIIGFTVWSILKTTDEITDELPKCDLHKWAYDKNDGMLKCTICKYNPSDSD